MKLKVPIERKEINGFHKDGDLKLDGIRCHGFNDCLLELDQCSIEFDEEKLAFKLFTLEGQREERTKELWNVLISKQVWIDIAKAIINSMPEILTIKKGE